MFPNAMANAPIAQMSASAPAPGLRVAGAVPSERGDGGHHAVGQRIRAVHEFESHGAVEWVD